jgi:CBS domain containing-hemolysin-like protein
MSPTALEVAIIAAGFFGSAFFAGVEIGLVSCDRIRLRYLSERGDHRARLLLNRLIDPERLVALTLVGTNLSGVIASAVFTNMALRLWGERGAAVAIALFILVTIVFTEIVPKALFRVRADSLVLASAYPLAVAGWVLGWAARLFHAVSLVLLRIVPGGSEEARPRLTRDELAHFFERSAHAGGAGRRWFRAVLGLSERTVERALVPVEDLPRVSENDAVELAARVLRESGESFLLVLAADTGKPVGTASVHDLLDLAPGWPIRSVTKPAPAVPAGRRIEDLLPEIQAGTTPIVFVTNGGGDVIGIVTHESIAFGIVGAIEEAH